MTFALIWLLCAVIAAIIGAKKGLGCASFAVGLLFGPFGILIAHMSKGHLKTCPHCREQVHWEATACPRCTRPIDPAASTLEPLDLSSAPRTSSSEPRPGELEHPSQASLGRRPSKPSSLPAWVLPVVLGVIAIYIAAVIYIGGSDTARDNTRTLRVSSGTSESSQSDVWCEAPGNLWRGVKLYYGPTKFYVGEVLGGNDRYVSPLTGRHMRGVKIRYPDGSEEWKDRSAMIRDGRWFIKCDDPALARMEWRIYEW